MEWAMGFTPTSYGKEVAFLGFDGSARRDGVASLLKTGVPLAATSKRLVLECELSDLSIGGAAEYLEAFGMRFAAGQTNHHDVLFGKTRIGHPFQIPALVLMRAMFKPNQQVFPAMFTPANVDTLSFVDYGAAVPQVVIHDKTCRTKISIRARGTNQAEALRWLQTSLSARRCAQGIHFRAMSGALGMEMPQGRAKIILHGLPTESCLFVTKAVLMSCSIAPEDSITGREERFDFRANGNTQSGAVGASAFAFSIPVHRDGTTSVTDDEWHVLETLMEPPKRKWASLHSRRAMLDVILHKLDSRIPWHKAVAHGMTKSQITLTFRRWVLDGRMDRAIERLGYMRQVRAIETRDVCLL